MFSFVKICSKNNSYLILRKILECHSNCKKTVVAALHTSNLKHVYKSGSTFFYFKKPNTEFDKKMLSEKEVQLKMDIPKELDKLKKEFVKAVTFHNEHYEFRDQRHTMDLLYIFERESDLQKFVVSTDSSNDVGYSSASLKISQSGTAIFSGNLCTEIPKTGNVSRAGFANISSKRIRKSFQRLDFHNWSRYTHLVLKVRGDGRTYKIILSTPGEYNHEQYMSYNYPLYTRGGPYWQITKIPFSHFYFSNIGRIVENQGWVMPLNKIARFGITIADNTDGPFKLEIDYVGLEYLDQFKVISPYETYYVGRHMAS